MDSLSLQIEFCQMFFFLSIINPSFLFIVKNIVEIILILIENKKFYFFDSTD